MSREGGVFCSKCYLGAGGRGQYGLEQVNFRLVTYGSRLIHGDPEDCPGNRNPMDFRVEHEPENRAIRSRTGTSLARIHCCKAKRLHCVNVCRQHFS
jgi:hypothetical protein